MMIFILIYVKYLKRLGQCSFLYYLTNLIFLGRKWGGEKWPKTEHRDVSSYFHAKKFVYKSSPNLCVNSSFSYVVLSTLLLSSRDLTEWSLVYHSTLSYQRFYNLHSIHYDHLEGLHQLI